MDKAQALHAFWSSFGLPAIDEQSAYDKATLEMLEIQPPYITYQVATSNIETPVALSASLWWRSTSWGEITRKAAEIAAYIGYGGRIVKINGGYMWVKLGSPFAQRMGDEQNTDYRRIVLSIEVDFLTST